MPALSNPRPMLFCSQEFVLLFLPITVVGYFILGGVRTSLAAGWLCIASLIFYSIAQPRYLVLLLASIAFNYLCGKALRYLARQRRSTAKYSLLVTGIAANLIALSFYKYSTFIVQNMNAIIKTESHPEIGFVAIVLPIGISFYTFTQIAYLVDCFRTAVADYGLVRYALFVSYFPHLIAGPILHHGQLMPQLEESKTYHFDGRAFSRGIVIFIIGLLQKLFLADVLGDHVDSLFGRLHSGAPVTFGAAWAGAVAFALQIYFDFGGYSQMAVGISLLFGITIPQNFRTPYRATSIIDFWRRWHLSLSAFLREYVYIPLGGNRLGSARRYFNLLITMLLGGLWHGANWTFVLWGGMHGAMLCGNNMWRSFNLRCGKHDGFRLPVYLSWSLTFLALCFSWVLFRSVSLEDALFLWGAMLHPTIVRIPTHDSHSLRTAVLIMVGLAICLLEPEPLQWYPDFRLAAIGGRRALVKYSCLGALFGALMAVCVTSMAHARVFLYFRF